MRILSALVLSVGLICCKDSSALRDEFIRQRILEYEAKSDTLTISDELLKWDSTDFIVKYLDKTIDTTTRAVELINASRATRTKIIFLINALIKKDLNSFKEQIERQSMGTPIKIEQRTNGDSTMPDRTIKFSQPLVSTDNNTIIIEEWDTGNGCWGTKISIYHRVENKWIREYDLYDRRTCI